MKTVTKEDILYSLRLMGVRPGDVLLVHSALSSIGHVEGGADSVIDALMAAVGGEGTLVMSTLTGWSQPFDADSTPSAVGVISETFRRRPGVLRSLHPVHSVAAWGRRAAEITAGHENCPTGCGEGTPYMKIAALGGKAVLLGVDMDRNTIMHTLEELSDVKYLRTLDICAPTYLPGAKKFTLRKFPPGHRDFLRMTPLLRRADAMTEGVVGSACVKIVDIRKLFELALPLLRKDPLFFICENEHCNSCRWSRSLYSGEKIDPARYAAHHCDDPACEICVI